MLLWRPAVERGERGDGVGRRDLGVTDILCLGVNRFYSIVYLDTHKLDPSLASLHITIRFSGG